MYECDVTYIDMWRVCWQLYPDQIQVLLDAFKNPPQTREEGLYFEDKQYKCVRADKNSIYAKQVCDVTALIQRFQAFEIDESIWSVVHVRIELHVRASASELVVKCGMLRFVHLHVHLLPEICIYGQCLCVIVL